MKKDVHYLASKNEAASKSTLCRNIEIVSLSLVPTGALGQLLAMGR